MRCHVAAHSLMGSEYDITLYMERTVVFYHGGCPDGFGGAYAAWKKFGDTAEYVSLSRGEELPYEMAKDAEVYFIDFSYNQEEMEKFNAIAKRMVVLDHHQGVESVITSMPNHVYDTERSGAGIAWDYFHPDLPRPQLINFLEDDDLFRFRFPDTRPILSYLGLHPFTFEFWDETSEILEDPIKSEKLLAKARIFGECFEKLAEVAVERAKMIEFEGYTVAFATAHPYKPIKSLVGNLLAKKFPPFALVVAAHPDGYGVSIRSDGSVNVAQIAEKFGGNGHPYSAGFLIPREGPFPWTRVPKDEAARD